MSDDIFRKAKKSYINLTYEKIIFLLLGKLKNFLKKIRKGTFRWLNSAAEDGYTAVKNLSDLKKYKIKPKILSKNFILSYNQKILVQKLIVRLY